MDPELALGLPQVSPERPEMEPDGVWVPVLGHFLAASGPESGTRGGTTSRPPTALEFATRPQRNPRMPGCKPPVPGPLPERG